MDKEDVSAMETVTRRTWLEVENEKTSQSVCGLEISFQAPPQAIDIRLLNSQGETISTTSQDCTGATAKTAASETNSISSETINLEINKTRQ